MDATGSIAIESSGAQILIGDDEVDQAIKVGTSGVHCAYSLVVLNPFAASCGCFFVRFYVRLYVRLYVPLYVRLYVRLYVQLYVRQK